MPVTATVSNIARCSLHDGPGVRTVIYLKGCGLEPIKAKGEVFDVDYHEAVTQFPAPSEEMKGKVIDVVQTGYMLGGKVIRYAKVVVGA